MTISIKGRYAQDLAQFDRIWLDHGRVKMRLFCLLICALLLSSARPAEASNSPELEVLRTQVLLRQSVLDQARARVTHAKFRLNDLITRSRTAQANRSTTPPVRNPHWEALQKKLLASEEVARRLAEKLAPAHPEMQAAESEVRSLRERLAATAEYQNPPVDEFGFDSAELDSEVKHSVEMQSAERELRQAEDEWETANREYQKSISDLASWRPSPPAPVETELKELAEYSVWPIWMLAGIPVMAFAAIALRLHFRSPTSVSDPRSLGTAKRHTTRIVYKPQTPTAASTGHLQPRLDVSPTLPNRRAPIVPRRRDVSNC